MSNDISDKIGTYVALVDDQYTIGDNMINSILKRYYEMMSELTEYTLKGSNIHISKLVYLTNRLKNSEQSTMEGVKKDLAQNRGHHKMLANSLYDACKRVTRTKKLEATQANFKKLMTPLIKYDQIDQRFVNQLSFYLYDAARVLGDAPDIYLKLKDQTEDLKKQYLHNYPITKIGEVIDQKLTNRALRIIDESYFRKASVPQPNTHPQSYIVEDKSYTGRR